MKKAQIIEKSCHREGLKIERIRNFLRANDYELLNDDNGLDPTNKYAFPLENLTIHPDADLIILTTCGFSQAIEDGDFEALRLIKENKKISAKIIVAGCIVKLAPERLKAEFDGDCFDAQSYTKLNDFVEHKISFEEVEDVNNLKNCKDFIIKIQDGCNHRCSYCNIWKAAGTNRSKPLEQVMKEFRHGLSLGNKHFYLLGECSGAYGMDFGSSLAELLREFIKVDEDYDILIEDVSPIYFLKCFNEVKTLAQQGKIRSFHTPIQSGSDRILKLMKRPANMREVQERLLELRETYPGITLSSAVIVGFPTETLDDLQMSIDYCNNATFNTVACHMFSKRPGAPAATMEGQISEEEKARRYHAFKKDFEGHVRVDPNQRKYVNE